MKCHDGVKVFNWSSTGCIISGNLGGSEHRDFRLWRGGKAFFKWLRIDVCERTVIFFELT